MECELTKKGTFFEKIYETVVRRLQYSITQASGNISQRSNAAACWKNLCNQVQKLLIFSQKMTFHIFHFTDSWVFHVDPYLQLHLQFSKIYFASSMFDCSKGSITVSKGVQWFISEAFFHEKALNRFVYCGHYSEFSLCPAFLHIAISRHVQRYTEFQLHLSFQVHHSSPISLKVWDP